MRLDIIDVPTNLGLRPPPMIPGSPAREPGAVRSPAALRAAGLHDRLRTAGAEEPPEVPAGTYRPTRHGKEPILNLPELLAHTDRLAEIVGGSLQRRRRVLAVGGDCSLLLGVGSALRRRGRFGLVHIDGHTDFRHPGNSESYGFVAGEDLAVVVGRHRTELRDHGAPGPFVTAADAVQLGCRDDDEHLDEAAGLLGDVVPATDWLTDPDRALARVRSVLERPGLDGYWIHLDVDVLDPSFVDAVDSPTPGGVDPDTLASMLRSLLPGSSGLDVCCFDPDLDDDGRQAAVLATLLVEAIVQEGGASNPRHARTGV